VLRAVRWLVLSIGATVLFVASVAVGAGIVKAATAADSGWVQGGGAAPILGANVERQQFDRLAVRATRVPAAVVRARRLSGGRSLTAGKRWHRTADSDVAGKRWRRTADSDLAGKRWHKGA